MKNPESRSPVTTALLMFFLTIASSLASLPHIPKNSHAISSNGKYRLDCIAENVEGKEFKLTDLASKKVLWSQTRELMEEAKAIHLDDDGNSVIENLEFDLVFTDAKGQITGKINLPKDGLTSKEYKTYVEDTTAGPLWGHHLATSYFLKKGKNLLFVVRHWWGRRLVVDFYEGKPIEADKQLLSICVEREKKIAVGHLKRVLKDVEANRHRWSPTNIGKILMAGQLPCPQAAPLLEKLQHSTDEFDAAGMVIDLSLRRLLWLPGCQWAIGYFIHLFLR